MHLNWTELTLRNLQRKDTTLPGTNAIIPLPRTDTWVLLIIETALNVPHPVHLHGHDFLVVAQGSGPYRPPQQTLTHAAGTIPKRDTALLPGSGHLVLAFKTDNPGAWLLHCHIGWHIEQGFAIQFVEQEAEIRTLLHGEWSAASRVMEENCEKWDSYWAERVILDNGSGV